MLFREDGNEFIAISQPAHAWLSGQIARAWGNDQVGYVEPREELLLAAEQHDIGWTTWEAAPTLNTETGRPHSFQDMPAGMHINLWSQASSWALISGRYPALFVSLHGTGLYERFGAGSNASPEVQEGAQAFLNRERAFQQRLIASLEQEPRYREHVSVEAISRNRRLISVWDAMSLMICSGLPAARTIENLPAPVCHMSLTLAPADGAVSTITVSPWPFNATSVTVIVEGRRLTGRYTDERQMRAALDQAEWITIETRLSPESGKHNPA